MITIIPPSIEMYIILPLFALVLMITAAISIKPSPATIRRLITDYEIFLKESNEIAEEANAVINQIKDKVFVSPEDKSKTLTLIQQYNAMFSEVLIYNDRLGFYIGKRNVRNYKRYKRKALYTLSLMQRIIDELKYAEKNMQTEEEYERTHHVHEEPRDSKGEETEDIPYANYNGRIREEKNPETPSVFDTFFAGCNTDEEIKKRYISLAKVYHPDLPSGDSETFRKIKEEYERRYKP